MGWGNGQSLLEIRGIKFIQDNFILCTRQFMFRMLTSGNPAITNNANIDDNAGFCKEIKKTPKVLNT